MAQQDNCIFAHFSQSEYIEVPICTRICNARCSANYRSVLDLNLDLEYLNSSLLVEHRPLNPMPNAKRIFRTIRICEVGKYSRNTNRSSSKNDFDKSIGQYTNAVRCYWIVAGSRCLFKHSVTMAKQNFEKLNCESIHIHLV